ncbi:MAG TPA: ABC transporter substrate-binding protein [Casimicrobiaceae bacterium]|nr:ABC transporter substrate-binding protein [Casimicrobiaceae bacterium]
MTNGFGSWARTLALVALVLLQSVGGSAWAQGAAKPIRVANGTTLDILTIPDVRTFDYYLPNKYGLKGEIEYVPGAVRAIQAVLTGASDIGIATLAAGLEAVDKGQDVQCFALAAGARPYFYLVGESSIKDLKDLQGKSVGIISLVDSTYYVPAMQMAVRGLDPASVRWVSAGGGAGRANAMISGSVQAVALQAGQALQLIAQNGNKYHMFANSGKDLDKLIFKCFWAKKSWLKEHGDIAENIVAAQLLATREALNKESFLDLAVPLLAPQTRATLSQAYDLIKEQGAWDPNGELLNKTAGNFTSQQMAQYKIIQRAPPFEAWATTEFVERAIKKVGAAK